MLEIRKNPEAIYNRVDDENFIVKMYGKEIILRGVNVEKYFIPIFDYFIAPSSLEKLTLHLKKTLMFEPDYDKIHSIVLTLIKERILLCQILRREIEDSDEINILLIDFSKKKLGRKIKNIFDNSDDLIAHNYETTLVEYETFDDLKFEVLLEKEYHIVIPIFWEVEPEVIEKIGQFGLNCILPIISNYNYFSIGPQISPLSSLANAIFSLRKEMSRYYYVNNQIKCSNFSIFLGHVITEIIEITNLFYSNTQENNSMTIKDMITFNYNSFCLIIKRYRNIERGDCI